MYSQHAQSDVLDAELQALLISIAPIIDGLRPEQVDAFCVALKARQGASHGLVEERRGRQWLYAAMLPSALAGACFVLALDWWILGVQEARVLFALFMAACFYVIAEAGFDKMNSARECRSVP